MVSNKVLMILLIHVRIIVSLIIFCMVLMFRGVILVILLIWARISNDFWQGFNDSPNLC